MMKKISMYLVGFFLIAILLGGCGKSNEDSSPQIYANMDLEHQYQSLNELRNDSDIIAEVRLTGKTESLTYGGADFTMTEAALKKIMKNDATASKGHITILELSVFNMNQFKTNGKYVLFLKKYEGPVTQVPAYVITGVYQGKFNITDNGEVRYDAEKYGGINTFQKNVNSKKLAQFEGMLAE